MVSSPRSSLSRPSAVSCSAMTRASSTVRKGAGGCVRPRPPGRRRQCRRDPGRLGDRCVRGRASGRRDRPSQRHDARRRPLPGQRAAGGAAGSSAIFILARIIGGLGVGAASVISPVYISEVTPASIRGRLSSVQQVMIITGLTGAFVANFALARYAGGSTAEFWLGFPPGAGCSGFRRFRRRSISRRCRSSRKARASWSPRVATPTRIPS